MGGIFLWSDFARGFFLRRDLRVEGFLLKAGLLSWFVPGGPAGCPIPWKHYTLKYIYGYCD